MYCVEGNVVGIDCKVMFDFNSIIIFDNGYFWSLVFGCVIFIFDDVFCIDFCMKDFVVFFVRDEGVFFIVFVVFMVKMGCISVFKGIVG